VTFSKTKTIIIVIALAILLLASLILVQKGPAPPAESENAAIQATVTIEKPTAPPGEGATPTPTSEELENDAVAVTVNGQTFSSAEWEQIAKLDAAMNALAGHPPPDAEESLDRLINETLIFNALPATRSFSEADVETRLESLLTGWQISEAELLQTLDAAALSLQNLRGRIAYLLVVEDIIQQLNADGLDLNEWLTQARSQAEIGFYQSFDTPSSSEAEAAASAPRPESPTPEPPTPTPEPAVDLPTSPYPDALTPDCSLNTLTGEEIALSQLRGKPTIINFWASWCPPCRQELPALQAAYNAYKDDINFLAINVKEDEATVTPFAETMALTFPILLDKQGEVSDNFYQVRGIPTTLFVDAKGIVTRRHVGPLDKATIDAYLHPLLASQSLLESEDETAVVETPVDETDAQAEAPSNYPPRAGDKASNFSLTDSRGESFDLNQMLEQRSVALVFYRGSG